MATALIPAAPPPATSTASRGSIPRPSVMSSIARTMCSVASRSTAIAASSTVRFSRAADVALQRLPRGVHVERDRATEEVAGIDVPEHDRRVGDRRAHAAARVTGRARIGARAARPDAKQAALVDPGDAAAAGADALDVDRREPGEVALVLPAEPRLARPRDPTVAHEADVVARAAGVGDHRGGGARLALGVVAARDRRHRRTRVDRVDRRGRHRVGVEHAAAGGDHQQPPFRVRRLSGVARARPGSASSAASATRRSRRTRRGGTRAAMG